MIERTNTILYCQRWKETVAFFREVVGLDSTFSNEWFVEYAIGDGSHLSIADTSRATVASSRGDGITLSWRVADVDVMRRALIERGGRPEAVHRRWGTDAFHLFDPEGHRLEFWSELDAEA